MQLSGLFTFFMCGCNAVLAYVLIKAHSLTAWVHAPASFVESIRAQPDVHVGLTLLSVVAMVVCGADYQQFPIDSRTPTDAQMGCLIAAAIVLGWAFFLPRQLSQVPARGIWLRCPIRCRRFHDCSSPRLALPVALLLLSLCRCCSRLPLVRHVRFSAP